MNEHPEFKKIGFVMYSLKFWLENRKINVFFEGIRIWSKMNFFFFQVIAPNKDKSDDLMQYFWVEFRPKN